jgi:predicted acylesterase/phospholipase RssA
LAEAGTAPNAEQNPPNALMWLEELWYSLSWNEDMWVEEPWLRDLEDAFKVPVLLSKSILPPFVPLTGLNLLLNIDFGELVQGLSEMADAVAMFNIDPIRGRMSQGDEMALDQDLLRRSTTEFWAVTVGLESGQASYIDKRRRFVYGHKLPGRVDDIRDAVMASAAIPSYFPPVLLFGEHFVDGGVRELLPVDGAVAAGGQDIVAISASPLVTYKPAPRDGWKLLDISFRAVFDLLTDEVAVNDTALLARWPADLSLRVVMPTYAVHDVTTIDPGLNRIQMHYGFMRAFDTLAVAEVDQKAQFAELSDEITKQRVENWRLEYEVAGLAVYGPEPIRIFELLDGSMAPAWNLRTQAQAVIFAMPGFVAPNTEIDLPALGQHGGGPPPLNANALQRLRIGKRRVQTLVQRRLDLAAAYFDAHPHLQVRASVPGNRQLGTMGLDTGYPEWWRKWERHPWTNLDDYASPWVGMAGLDAEPVP